MAWLSSMLNCLQASLITYHLLRPQILSAQQPIWAMPTLWRQSLTSLPTSPSPRLKMYSVQKTMVARTAYLCSDFLGAEESGVQTPMGARFSIPIQTGPEAHRTSCTMGTWYLSLQGVRQPGHGNDHSLQSSAKFKERVELHFHASFMPTWQVSQWNWSFCRGLYHQCYHVQILPKPSLSNTTQPRQAEEIFACALRRIQKMFQQKKDKIMK
jgi:hypothetical protein